MIQVGGKYLVDKDLDGSCPLKGSVIEIIRVEQSKAQIPGATPTISYSYIMTKGELPAFGIQRLIYKARGESSAGFSDRSDLCGCLVRMRDINLAKILGSW